MAPLVNPTLHYHLGMERPNTHLFQVELTVPPHPGEFMDLALPAWTPGAYKIVDNARNLRGLIVLDGHGARVPVTRLDLHTWRVHHRGAGFTVRYQVFADKMLIHQAQLNASHAFVNGCMVFLYPKGNEHWGAKLTVDAPPDWKVASALETTAPNVFVAPSYDALIDAPLEIGTFEMECFVADETVYRIVWNGPEPMDRPQLVGGLYRIVRTINDFWGGAPFPHYTFIYNVTKDSYLNGLEHGNSTAIQGPIDLDKNAHGFFAMSAHEYFHVWNIKRLRPIGLGPFDYSRPAHTTALWVVEGMTEYYTELMCLRAGIHSVDDFFHSLCDSLSQLERSPGRKFTTLEEASFITWNFGDDRWNGAINYYLKGSLMAMALDLDIREKTDNEKSLDDVMRLLWERFGAPDLPYDPEEAETAIEEVVGQSMEAFFDLHLRSTQDADWTAVFAKAGIELSVLKDMPSLQLRGSDKDSGILIEDVRAQGAAEQAGLMAGDRLVAIGGRRASESMLGKLDTWFKVGESVPLEYVRGDRLQGTTLVLQADRTYQLKLKEDLTPLQARIATSWLRPQGSNAQLEERVPQPS